jgi:hypothetical protein
MQVFVLVIVVWDLRFICLPSEISSEIFHWGVFGAWNLGFLCLPCLPCGAYLFHCSQIFFLTGNKQIRNKYQYGSVKE